MVAVFKTQVMASAIERLVFIGSMLYEDSRETRVV
jgi:hypothetical protein